MGTLDTKDALLQALMEGDNYGLALIDRINKRTGGHITLLQGGVYPALRQLELDGLIESYDGPPMSERGGRPRRYYKVTAAGEKAARRQARAVYRLLKPALGEA